MPYYDIASNAKRAYTMQQEDKIKKEKFISNFNYFKPTIIRDLNINKSKNSAIYKKYSKDKVVKFLKSPQVNESKIRELSRYLYQVSTNYRRLIDHYATILLFNYIISPLKLYEEPNKDEFYKEYKTISYLCEKYQIEKESKRAMKIAIRDGVFFGLYYETDECFYLQNFDAEYAQITAIEDGCLLFQIDLNYFTGKDETILHAYGDEIALAYLQWKKDSKKHSQYFTPSNCFCIKADATDLLYSLPLFTGLILSIYDIEDYKMLQKAKTENENYMVLSMKMDVDEDGLPKMDEEMANIYYDQASVNIADNVGLMLTPWEINKFSFQSNSASEKNVVTDAENQFWAESGTPPILFGSSKATSSSALDYAVKPDEQIAIDLLNQIERFFNYKFKKMNFKFCWKLEFLKQTIFNKDKVSDSYQKAASNGVGGSKLKYASSLGITPSDILGLSYLENDVLEVGVKLFNRPLINSNTLSNGKVSDTGRPTNESKGEILGEAGELANEYK